jgi:uncharacterized membrane protein
MVMNLPFPETALQSATRLAYVVHVGCGTVGLVSGTVAAFAQKGERLHRAAGTVFFVSMLVMAAFAAWLAIVIPGQMSNLQGAILTFYLVATAWLTVRRKQRTIGGAEKFALAAILCLCVSLGGWSIAAAAGVVPGVRGQLLIATYMVTAIAAVTAMGDARRVWIRQRPGAAFAGTFSYPAAVPRTYALAAWPSHFLADPRATDRLVQTKRPGGSPESIMS